MTQTIMKVFLAFIFVSRTAHAEDVYNFYFQKNKKKEIEVVAEAPKAEEPVQEEYIEVPHDVLLVPDNWQPANLETKKYYIKKPAQQESNTLSTEPEKEKEGRSRQGWSMSVGVGTIKIASQVRYYYGLQEVSQDVYAVGARYHMSKYFDVNAEVLAPNGDYQHGSWGSLGGSLDPQVNIGLGVTPIHLDVFGGEFFEIGFDGGVSMGNRDYLNDSNTVYLGPRVSLNIGDHFKVTYAVKLDMDSSTEYTMNTLSVGYAW